MFHSTQLTRMENKLDLLLQKAGVTMSDLDDLKAGQQKLDADVQTETTDITAAIAAGQAASSALKKQLADALTEIANLQAAGTVSPADLQSLTAKLAATDANVTTIDASIKAAAAAL
jgi:chromosome segregation ATPase